MAGVIFVIGRDYAEHWDRALDAGFWETEHRVAVNRGDLLVFWQAGDRKVLGVSIAVAATEPVDYHLAARPWLTRDMRSYHFRYRFQLLATTSLQGLKWSELAQLVGTPRAGANFGPTSFSDEGAQALASAISLPGSLLPDDDSTSFGERLARDVLDSSQPTATALKPYDEADEAVTTLASGAIARDAQAVDRGLRGHAQTQNKAAAYLRSRSIEPLSPVGAVNFDLAWLDDGGQRYVGEVKSLHSQNERFQMRLGIGEVLEFAFRLQAKPVLIVERRPSADYWVNLCQAHHIALAWPGAFDRLPPGT